VAVATLAWNVRRDLSAVVHSLDPVQLAISYALGLASATLQARLFAEFLSGYAPGVDAGAGTRLMLRAQLAKYLPGRIWSLVYQATAAPAAVTPRHLLLANGDLFLITFVHVATVATAAYFWPRPAAWAALGLGTVIATVAGAGQWAGRGLRLAARVIRWRLELPPSRPSVGLQPLLGLNAAAVLVNLAASILLLRSIFPTTPAVAWKVLSAYGFATALGSLVMIVPAGLGVREFLAVGIGGLVAPPLASTSIASVALIVRVWQVAVDLGGAVLAALRRAPPPRSRGRHVPPLA
jgi:hypothetical protein